MFFAMILKFVWCGRLSCSLFLDGFEDFCKLFCQRLFQSFFLMIFCPTLFEGVVLNNIHSVEA